MDKLIHSPQIGSAKPFSAGINPGSASAALEDPGAYSLSAPYLDICRYVDLTFSHLTPTLVMFNQHTSHRFALDLITYPCPILR